MSIVLWANILVDGKVETDSSDKYYLYKYSKKLDKLTGQLKLISFSSIQDSTDMQYNLEDRNLPDGMESTTEVMAKTGVWTSGGKAAEMLEKLLSHITTNGVKFGFLKNDHAEVVFELKESLKLAQKAKKHDGSFNYSIVM